jgi:hypothetical protein
MDVVSPNQIGGPPFIETVRFRALHPFTAPSHESEISRRIVLVVFGENDRRIG